MQTFVMKELNYLSRGKKKKMLHHHDTSHKFKSVESKVQNLQS